MSQSLIVYPAAFPTYFYLVCVETNGKLCAVCQFTFESEDVFYILSLTTQNVDIFIFVVFITTEVLLSSTPGMCIISFLLVT